MTRKIHCEDCNTHLGEIRDATLRKNTKHYCCACSDKKKDPDANDFISKLLGGEQPDAKFMGGLFNNVRGRKK